MSIARSMLTALVVLVLSSAAGCARQPLAASEKTLELAAGPGQADFQRGSVFFVGNATVIIRYGGFTILTDPNFLHKGDHVHLGYGLEAERLTDPAIDIEQLPPIDLVVLSHYHGDHFDQLVEKKLDKRIPIVTPPHAAEQLRERGFQVLYPLQTWETLTVAKGEARLKIASMPGRHGPTGVAVALPPVMGSMLEFERPGGQTAYRLYISGDTLMYDEIEEIPKRFPDIDLALLHLGGTKVLGILVTMDAEQGVEALQVIAPETAIPIHYNDYDVFESPLEDFVQAVKAAGLESKVRYLRHGETYGFRARAAR